MYTCDVLLVCYLTSDTRIIKLCEDVTIAGEGLQNLGLCSVQMTFEQDEKKTKLFFFFKNQRFDVSIMKEDFGNRCTAKCA